MPDPAPWMRPLCCRNFPKYSSEISENVQRTFFSTSVLTDVGDCAYPSRHVIVRDRVQVIQQIGRTYDAAPPRYSETIMSNEHKTRRIYSLREAGEELNASRSSLYKLIASGDLKVFKIGRAVRVHKDDIDTLIDRLRDRAAERAA